MKSLIRNVASSCALPAHNLAANRLKKSWWLLTDSQSIRSIDHDPVLIARAADNLKVGAKGFPQAVEHIRHTNYPR